MEALRKEIVERLKNRESGRQILGNLVREHDTVILVMPQDPQAPQGRLILPQAQTIREGLDRHCLIMCVQTGELRQALSLFRTPPALIVTDSQAFRQVEPLVPDGTKLTSFSVLFAALKGDMTAYLEGVRALGELTETSRVLIAECCTHAPLEEDIGRVKIPRLLRARAGQGLRVDVAAGADFPENIGAYDLIIQCGACMMNRRFVLSRIARARAAGVPITNYGLALAALQGILDRVETGVPGGA